MAEKLEALAHAMLPYTSHSIGCAIYQRSWASGEPPCTCGLDEVRSRLTATPDRSDDALAEEKHRLRHMLIRSTLCLSGFVGEGISVEGYEDPDDVYLAAVELLGMEAADDNDLRAALQGDGL